MSKILLGPLPASFWDAVLAYDGPDPIREPLAYLLHEAAQSPERAAELRAVILEARDACIKQWGDPGEHQAMLESFDRFHRALVCQSLPELRAWLADA